MTTQTCPSCGKAASGRFCADCGATLGAVQCASCSNALPPGGRFCNQCGTPAMTAAPASTAGPSRLPWVVAGVLGVALAGALLLPRLEGGDAPAPNAAVAPPTGVRAAAPGGAAGVDLSSMTPREAADRLFNRVMTAISGGDTAQARTFMPMALGAYDRVPAWDTDVRYHVAALHIVRGDPQAALAQTDTILQAVPDHLLALATAADARMQLGDAAEARSLYRRFLDRYDAEIGRPLPEYQHHGQGLPVMRDQARAVVGG